MEEYLKAKNIPHSKVGKLVVAANNAEIPSLERLFENASTNGVPNIRYLRTAAEIQTIEPLATGSAAIHSPETGIVNWADVARAFQTDVVHGGGDVHLGHSVTDMSDDGKTVSVSGTVTHYDARGRAEQRGSDRFVLRARKVLTCCGTQSDRVASKCGGARSPQVIPIRGEYLVIRSDNELAKQIRGNIYPVPVAGVPFLGVHFTPTLSGDVILGPNALLSLSREGYSYRMQDISVGDTADMLTYPGFWRLLAKHFPYGCGEVWRSVNVRAAVTRAQMYVPSLGVGDVVRGGRARAGVRAQAVDADGNLVDDFVFERLAGGKIVHARNAPSPAATSSMAIAETIADYLEAGATG